MNNTTGWITIAILIIIAVIVSIVAIAISFYHVTTQLDTSNPAAREGGNIRVRELGGKHPVRNPARLPRFNNDSTAGASNGNYQYVGNARSIRECGTDGTNSIRTNGRCECIPGYWGFNCELQSYSHNFLAIGNIDESNYECMDYKVEEVNNLSQCEQSCGDSCEGFYYQDNSCVLLSEVPSFKFEDMPTFEPMRQSNLYLKRDLHPIVTDRVFLYENILPLRYWLGIRDDVIAMEPGRLYQLPFLPEGWVNDSKYGLAYSDQPFKNISQAKFIQNGNSDFVPQLYRWVMVIPRSSKC